MWILPQKSDAKANGGKIVAINPLPEAGLIRFKNPQSVRALAGEPAPLVALQAPPPAGLTHVLPAVPPAAVLTLPALQQEAPPALLNAQPGTSMKPMRPPAGVSR